MHSFYDRISAEAAAHIDRLSKLMHELRDNRRALLDPYGAVDEAALLAAIADGSTAEHPAYEHYLGALVLRDTYQAAREDMAALLREVQKS
jgi:hypothetical protein